MADLKPSVRELLRVEDRISFLYLEFAALVRDGGSLKAVRDTGTLNIPVATVNVLWLGPSVTITHQAMTLIMECGTSLIWVGEDGLSFHASGRPLNGRTELLLAQAKIHTNPSLRLKCAKNMYRIRFGEDAPRDATSLNKLRGYEGARVKRVYTEYASRYNVRWGGRMFTPGDISKSDAINQALTISHHCLYAVISGVVAGLGMHGGMSVVHNGTQNSFIYDIADLYKTEVCVPVAFRVIRDYSGLEGSRLAHMVRAEMRVDMTAARIVPRAVKDIYKLLLSREVDAQYESSDYLWDTNESVAGGTNYGRDE